MAIPPDDISGMFAHLAREIDDLKRRNRGRVREGKIVAANQSAGLYRVDLGEGFLSPWLPVEALSSGALRIQGEPVVGQTVTVRSESGDLTDATIALSSFTAANARPHDKAGELVIDVGGTRITATASKLTLASNGSSIELDAAGVRIAGARIDLN
ncbi:MAG: phage baseplate assembly protein V [Amaricoccus sp.]